MDADAARLDVLPYWMHEDDREGPAGDGRARTCTRLGTIGSADHGLIDPTGLANVVRGGPSVDWWVGAEDRWHVPARSATVRQTLIGACPVVETRMRVPGGDIVHRAYAIQDAGPEGGRGLLVVQIENSSAVPVALALAVRPYDLERLGTTTHIELDGTTVRADGRDVVYLPKPPQSSATSTAADGDVSGVVFDGGATAATTREVTCPDGLAQAAFVFPLTHTASLTVAMPLTDGGRGGVPSAVPSADQVVRGWVTQSDRGMRLVLPGDRLQSAVDANRRYLLSFSAGVDIVSAIDDGDEAATSSDLVAASAVIQALDHYGFHDEAGELLAPFADLRLRRRLETAHRHGYAALLSALVNHHDLTVPPSSTIVPVLARAVQLLQDAGRPRFLARLRSGRTAASLPAGHDDQRMRDAFEDCARLFRAVGEDAAAASAQRFAASMAIPDDDEPGPEEVFVAVDSLLSEASSTWTWARLLDPRSAESTHGRGVAGSQRVNGHSPSAAARFLSLVRDLLVRSERQALVLLPLVPRSWYGRGLEVHHAPTRFGHLSYAIRWHEERPALLWEITGSVDPTGVVLRCPGLDPDWSTTELRGETLLAAPPT